MKDMIFPILIVAIMLISGCTGAAPQAPQPGTNVTQGDTYVNNSPVANNSPPANVSPAKPPPATGEGTIVDVGNSTTSTAHSQEDCATMSTNCASCIQKAGCGWCKGTGCFYGTASGPSAGTACQPGDWATTPAACEGPVGGSTCGSKTNCADCLSGSGCQWCQGSTETCASGGWRKTSYECYGGQ
jgi:hypothetical protein